MTNEYSDPAYSNSTDSNATGGDIPNWDAVPPKPTRDTVLRLLSDAHYYWNVRLVEQNTDYTYFTLQQAVNVPQGFNVIRPPTPYTICSATADQIGGDRPNVEIHPINNTLKAEQKSEKLERALNASLDRFFQERPESQVRTAGLNISWAGMICSQGPIFDPDCWGLQPERDQYDSEEKFQEAKESYDERKRQRWPFYWRMVDPRWVYPDPGTTGKRYVIVSYQRTVGDIKAQWPNWDGRIPGSVPTQASASYSTLGGALGGAAYGGGSIGSMTSLNGYYRDVDQIQWVEYWDTKWRVYMAGNVVLDVSEHSYGKPPFQIRSSGLGDDTGLPWERYRSLLYPVRSMLDQDVRIACQIDAIMRQHAWPQIMTPKNSGFGELQPGTVREMDIPDIEATKAFTALPQGLLDALLKEQEVVREAIFNATVPVIVMGQKAPGLPSGFGQNSLVAQAKIRFGPMVNAIESMMGEFMADLLHCVKYVVKEPVPIWGPTASGFVDDVLDPDDIDGYVLPVVKVNPKLPIDRANEIAIGTNLLKINAIDMDTFLTDFAGYDQPEEMRVLRMRDQILNSPAIHAFLTLAAAKEIGLDKYFMEMAKEFGMDPQTAMGAYTQFVSGAMGEIIPQQQALPPSAAPNTANAAGGTNILGNNAMTQQINPTAKTGMVPPEEPAPGSFPVQA